MPPRERRRSTLSTTHPAAAATTTATADAATPTNNTAPTTDGGERPQGSSPTPPTPVDGPARTKMSVTIADEVLDAAKDAWWATRNTTLLTFSGFVQEAMTAYVTQVAAQAGLTEFPPRPTQRLPAGRPAH
jgi:hypothetical protein